MLLQHLLVDNQIGLIVLSLQPPTNYSCSMYFITKPLLVVFTLDGNLTDWGMGISDIKVKIKVIYDGRVL